MRIAHNCSRCGSDLSGLRAPPDPHYHLPVVVCPRCAAACVRTRPEAVVLWREVSHLFYAWFRLAFQIGLAAFFASATASGAHSIAAGLFFRTGLVLPIEDWFRLGLLVLTVLGTGLWLGSCFPHWKRTTLLLAWSLLLLLIPVADSFSHAADAVAGHPWRHSSHTLGQVALTLWHDFVGEFTERAPATLALAGLALVQATVTPLGRVPVALNRVLVRAKNRRRRRMLRGSRGPR